MNEIEKTRFAEPLRVYDNAMKKWQVIQYEEGLWCVFRARDQRGEDGAAYVATVYEFSSIEAAHNHVRIEVVAEVVTYVENHISLVIPTRRRAK